LLLAQAGSHLPLPVENKPAAMKTSIVLSSLLLFQVHSNEVNPIGKVVQLITDLEAKITAEGDKAKQVFEEFSEWCEDRSRNLGFDIKTGKSEVKELKATIEQKTAAIGSLETQVDDLTAQIATDEADLKAAREIRAKEAADFAASEKEMVSLIDTLQRAIQILSREMAKTGSASMLQIKNAGNIAQAISVMIEASMIDSADGAKITALVQSQNSDEDSDAGAPAGDVYQSKSGSIVDALQGLHDKAEQQLADLRHKETKSQHSFNMLQQSIEDSLKYSTKELAEAKTDVAANGEKKATAEGDLDVTSKDLAADITSLADLQHDCLAKAEDYEASSKSRAEELKALAEGKKAIIDATSGAEKIQYGFAQVSFLQANSRIELANYNAVRFVRDLASKHNSAVLSQLASRMASAIRMSNSNGANPFGKVKGLISDMISRLEEEAGADAKHKAYCDKELAYSKQRHDEKTAAIEKLTTKIDQMTARSAQLKEEVAALEKALAELARSQAEMDKMRGEEHDVFVSQKADMEQGIEGVKLALKILNDYYGAEHADHESATGAATGIIGLLEVVESDFTKGLAGIIATEQSAAAAYDQQTKDNEIEKTMKDQDVKYKTKEAGDLDKETSEATSDRASVQTELDAINEYLDKLDKQCTEVAEPYEVTVERRAAEIAGLKEALNILENETSFLQMPLRRTLRGVRHHA